ncbi:MAG: hypothetical protein DRI95_02245 [Bacteroidetes bacterium]|nr:MAG: hypothetical protein DRI95_02245 [Bacteroidota bacterium]
MLLYNYDYLIALNDIFGISENFMKKIFRYKCLKDKKMKLGLFLIFTFVFNVNSLFVLANNIEIYNVRVTEKNTTANWMNIQFNVRGENFWRTPSDAQNWSAGWYFVKYRINDGIWQHATLSTNDADHEMPPAIFAEVDAASDGKGVFIHTALLNWSGNYNVSDLNIRWDYGSDGLADNETNIDISLFGIEMVYVPQGSFYLGSGGGETNTFYEYPNINTPYQINSENSIIVNNSAGNLYYTNDDTYSGDRGTIPAAFPKGYDAFYMMRYEISQLQYVDFLNTLTRSQQNNRTESDVLVTDIFNRYVMSNTNSVQHRNGIACNETGNGTTDPINFYCDLNNNGAGNEIDDGQNIACGYITTSDGLAYLDWAGLRPMTELEYEKACRGTVYPVANEYAWGTTNLTQTSLSITNSGQANEVASNTGLGLCNYGQDMSGFPYRCGYASTASTSREQAGASYYGILDLTGNIVEKCISIGNPEGRSFIGSHGDGTVDVDGNATNTDWPLLNSGVSGRGGHAYHTEPYIGVSSRGRGLDNRVFRFFAWGWRGVRTQN